MARSGMLETLATLFAFFVCSYGVDWDVTTALDEYVNRFDPYYDYYEIETIDHPAYTLHVLNMTSLKWFDEEWSEEPIWWHYLNIFVPKSPKILDAAYLVIGNGNYQNDNPAADTGTMKRTADFCEKLGVVSALLRTNPFQPIHFIQKDRNVTIPRTEDLIIGYTWKVFIEAEVADPDVVVLLPMTKAAKHALDTIQTFVKVKHPQYTITKFLPTGFSKRGWATWLLGCVDKRVFAMAPTVFDLLNMQANLEHHYRALGGWSWAFAPYWLEDVSRYLYHPRVQEIALSIDAISFNERLTMPKLLIAAAGDQFFPPDGSHYFWNVLTGPKLFQLWENDDHGLPDHQDIRDHNLEAFFLATYRNEALPVISWTRTENATAGQIVVTTDISPISVIAWWTNTTNETCEETSPDGAVICRRDFRKQALSGPTDIKWSQTDVTLVGFNQYTVVMNKREDLGFSAFFIQLKFQGPDDYIFTFSTEVHIIPDEFPYPKCETEEECRGRIV